MRIPEITVSELKALMDEDKRPFILDVRQPHEYEMGNIDAALIPLGDLPSRLVELEGHKEDVLLVVHCRSGGRSAQAVQFLRGMGYKGATNLKGGMIAWSKEIDSSVVVQ